MTISKAIELMRNDGLVARPNWNGKNMFIGINPRLGDYKEYIVMFTADGEYVPWLASQTDLLGEDWVGVTKDHVLSKDLTDKYKEYVNA